MTKLHCCASSSTAPDQCCPLPMHPDNHHHHCRQRRRHRHHYHHLHIIIIMARLMPGDPRPGNTPNRPSQLLPHSTDKPPHTEMPAGGAGIESSAMHRDKHNTDVAHGRSGCWWVSQGHGCGPKTDHIQSRPTPPTTGAPFSTHPGGVGIFFRSTNAHAVI